MAKHPIATMQSLLVCFAAFVAASLIGCADGQAGPERFTYRDHSRNEILLVDQKASTTSDGHIVQGFARCNGEFVCLRSPRLFFVVPKSLDSRQQWSMDDREFRIVRTETIALAGKQVETYRIESTFEGIHTWFNFSREVGLVAFGASSPQGTVSYRIDGSCGYGAKSCPSA